MARNNRMLKVGVIVSLTGVVAAAVIVWASSLDGQVEKNTSDIKETRTVIAYMREEQKALRKEQKSGFAHLEKVIREER